MIKHHLVVVGFDPWSVSSKGFEDILPPSSQTAVVQKSPVGTTSSKSELGVMNSNLLLSKTLNSSYTHNTLKSLFYLVDKIVRTG